MAGHAGLWPGTGSLDYFTLSIFYFPLFSIELLSGHFSPLSNTERRTQGAFALSGLEPGGGPRAPCQGGVGLGAAGTLLSHPRVLGTQEHKGLWPGVGRGGDRGSWLGAWRPLCVHSHTHRHTDAQTRRLLDARRLSGTEVLFLCRALPPPHTQPSREFWVLFF